MEVVGKVPSVTVISTLRRRRGLTVRIASVRRRENRHEHGSQERRRQRWSEVQDIRGFILANGYQGATCLIRLIKEFAPPVSRQPTLAIRDRPMHGRLQRDNQDDSGASIRMRAAGLVT